MSLSKFYESDASRSTEIVVGVLLLIISLVFWIGIAAILILAPIRLDVYLTVAVLLLIAFLLTRLSIRLILSRGRRDGSLLSPFAIYFGSLIFFVGGLGLILVGYVDSDWKPIAAGLGGAVASVYAFKLAKQRTKDNEI